MRREWLLAWMEEANAATCRRRTSASNVDVTRPLSSLKTGEQFHSSVSRRNQGVDLSHEGSFFAVLALEVGIL